MAGWLAAVAPLVTGALIFLASPVGAQPVTGHASNDDFLATVFVGSLAEGRIGDLGETNDFELSLGQQFPIQTDQFDWVSGETYNWTLSYEPGSIGGAVRFSFEGTELIMATATAFNSFFIRTSAERPDSSILVGNLSLGPAPSAGGGGSTIFETASVPQTPASSTADGNGAVLDVLKISGVDDLLVGFTLQGQVTMVFTQADPPPTGEQLAFQVYLAKAPDFPDADGDGVDDNIDNCVSAANSDQADDDLDGLGDVCDNCLFNANGPSEANIPGVGNQTDSDGDGAGDACDNCNPGCNLIIPPTGTCANNQNDTDGDLVGDRCDNCIGIANGPNEAGIPGVGDQLDTDGDGLGDACPFSTVIIDLGLAQPSEQGAPLVFSRAAALVPAAAALEGETEIAVSINCGQDVAFANIGLLLPPNTGLAHFSGCTANPDDDPPGDAPRTDATQLNCSNATTADPVLGITGLGSTIDKNGSFTIGRPPTGITDPVPGDGIPGPPARLVILRLQGNVGADNLICDTEGDEEELAFLGTLTLTNLPQFGAPSVSESGFDSFSSEPTGRLELLAGPAAAPIAAAQILSQVNPTSETKVSLSLRPAPTNPDRAYEVLLSSEFRIHRLAFGLTSPSGESPADIDFGGCQTPDAAAAGRRLCNGAAQPPLGSFVNKNSAIFGGTALVATYTEGPEDSVAGRLDNTLYVALEGDDGLAPKSLNRTPVNPGDPLPVSVLGIVEFASAADAPEITFFGAETLAGFGDEDGGPVQPRDQTEVITPGNVALLNSFDSSSDSDQDGWTDELDNCVATPNGGSVAEGGQADGGGVAIDFPDQIGTACQCGDSLGDGIVDNAVTLTPENDVAACQEVLAEEPGAMVDVEAFCAVHGGAEFGIVDLLILELETAGVDSGAAEELGLVPGSAGRLQACASATGL